MALLACDGYRRDLVQEKVTGLFELLGGPRSVVAGGESVYVKVNGLLGAAPDRAITTHPEVVRAVVMELKKVTDRITVGDSPGGPASRALARRVYHRCGFEEVARETGVELDFDDSVEQVTVARASTMKVFSMSSPMIRADRLISVCKLKTHMFMNITCAIKNMFGAVSGMNKFTYHSKFSRPDDFADLLVDVLLASSPDFHVVDAVEAMEGNGPSKGDVVRVGALAAGADALSLDTAMMGLIDKDPTTNLPLARAAARGLCTADVRDLVVLGDALPELVFPAFRLPDKKDISTRIPGWAMDRFATMLTTRPRPDPDRCTGCRKCADICPEHAVSIKGGVAVVDYSRCIRCFCCHELCEYGAIELERPLPMRLIGVRPR